VIGSILGMTMPASRIRIARSEAPKSKGVSCRKGSVGEQRAELREARRHSNSQSPLRAAAAWARPAAPGDAHPSGNEPGDAQQRGDVVDVGIDTAADAGVLHLQDAVSNERDLIAATLAANPRKPLRDGESARWASS
jgi:hypothetical protein